MLWKLVRIDPCFRWAVWLLLAGPLALLSPDYSLPMLVGIYSAALGITANAGGLQRRAPRYQMALPLPARTIWLSCLTVHLLLFLGPAVVFLPKFGMRVLAVVAAFLVAHAVLWAWQPQLASAPGWWVFVGTAAFLTAMFVLQIHQKAWLLGAAFAVAAALYVWAYSQVSLSFQLAPADAESSRALVSAGAPKSDEGWMARNRPFLRAFGGWPCVVFLIVIPLQTLNIRSGEAVLSMVFVPAIAAVLRKALLWMEATPIPRRRIFGWAMGVPLALYVTCFAIFGLLPGATLGRQPVDTKYIATSFAFAMTALLVFVRMTTAEMVQRWLTMPRSLGLAAIGLQLGAFFAVFLPLARMNGFHAKVSVSSMAAYRLSRYVTDEPFPLLILCVLALGGAYWGMVRIFERSDVPSEQMKSEAA